MCVFLLQKVKDLFLNGFYRFGTAEHFNRQDFLLLELICKAPLKYADYFKNDDMLYFYCFMDRL